MTEQIPLDLIDPNPFQPRLTEDAVATTNLADNIERNGLLQIPSARRVNGRVQLAFGHTRKAAFELLNKRGDMLRWNEMPLNIVELTDLQMFEAAVSENIQRRDLNPMEVAAAMDRYMNDFGKTSDECGAFFGVNGATVRGKVRLLDLPKAAQKKLAEGSISEGTARSLLSMAKVADEKTIQETLKDIETNDDGELPERIVERAIEYNDNVVEMWSSYKEGKPRAGNGLWLLDMKNFPNKMLAPVDPGDVQAALGLAEGDKTLDKIFSVFETYHETHPEDPAYADISFDSLNVPAEYLGRIQHLINPPACTACPFYMTMNKNHYCGVKICHERKAAAYKAQKIADMSRTLKIAVYQESDGAYLVLDNHAAHIKTFESRHADLRLLPKEAYHGYVWQDAYKGVDRDIVKVVVVGDSVDKLAAKGSKVSTGGKKTEKEKAEARAMRLYRQRRKEMMWDYVVEAEKIFAGVPRVVLENLNDRHLIGMDDRIPEEHDQERKREKPDETFQRRALVWGLITEHSSHYHRSDLVDQLEAFEEATTVKPSKDLVKRVKVWDAEIEALARPVAVETKTKGKKK